MWKFDPRVPLATLIRSAASLLVWVALAGWTASPASSQVFLDTIGYRPGGAGVHFLAGGFGGRFDMDGGATSEVVGGRAGVGLGEVVQLTGFLWRSVDRDARELLADRAYGGEARLALNAGLGLAPFLSAGVGRLEFTGLPRQTAAIAGAGFMLPLGPVLLSATAHDYILGVTGLGGDGIENATHNWLLSAGVTFGLGRGRRGEPIVVQRPAPPIAPVVQTVPAPAPGADPATVAAGVRSYHSLRTIEVPIPLEGQITLRYGPEPGITVNAAGELHGGLAPLGAAPEPLPPPPPGAAATFQDPAVQAWLRQVIDAQVAAQLRTRGVAPTQLGIDLRGLGTQGAVDGVLASTLLRMERAEAERMNALRNDLRQALATQSAQLREEINRLESRLTGVPMPPPPATPGPAPFAPTEVQPRPEPVFPAPVAPGAPVSPAPVADPRPGPGTLAAAEREIAQVRIALAESAIRHPRTLVTGETTRGPAIVLTDVAFSTGAALLAEESRAALLDVAAVLRRFPDRIIYIQGHSDGVGAELMNQRLSEMRAETVRSLLLQAGLDPSRLFAFGFGQGRPIADNATAAGRALNRRVEIVVGAEPSGFNVLAASEELDR